MIDAKDVAEPDETPGKPTDATVRDDVASSLWRLIVALNEDGETEFTNGDRAALRRFSPRSPDSRHMQALARALAKIHPRPAGREMVTAWSVIINAVALARPRPSGEPASLGAALRKATVSDGRLSALLSADLEALCDLAPLLARRLGQSGEAGAVRWVELARLVLTAESRDDAHGDIRLKIARDWLAQDAREKKA